MTYDYDPLPADLMGLILGETDGPRLAEEDNNIGDEAFIRADAFNNNDEGAYL